MAVRAGLIVVKRDVHYVYTAFAGYSPHGARHAGLQCLLVYLVRPSLCTRPDNSALEVLAITVFSPSVRGFVQLLLSRGSLREIFVQRRPASEAP
jgi:hypothetical protein